MIKAISQLSLPRKLDSKECIELAYRVGYKGYEPIYKSNSGKNHIEMQEMKEMTNGLDIKITSVASEQFWRYSLFSTDDKVRKKGIDIGKTQIEYCKYFDAPIALIAPGYYLEEMDYGDSLKRLQDSIYQLLEYGEELGVVLGMENVINGLFTSASEMVEFVDSFNSEYMGVYFDIGNAGYYNYPQLWAELLGKRIRAVHIKDFNRKVGNVNGFCPLLMGDIDFISTLQVLVRNGYVGAITGECSYNEEYPDLLPQYTFDALNKIFNSIKEN